MPSSGGPLTAIEVPTALDNGQRSPRKLLAAVVRTLVLALKQK